ncbi:MAG TPA: DUF2189 domain-containing protein [Giesbergeria sp.]|nr:DUF2189 domain-containing protein [Giesbergeria sp.]
MPKPTAVLPQVRSVAFTQPLTWLALGWRDMLRSGASSLVHGLVLAVLGMLIAVVAHDRFWLLAGAMSGFLVVAPVLATSFYVLSRTLERGEPAGLAVVLRTWLFWQNSHRSKWGNDYWCLVQFGALLALAGTGWVLVSSALITLLAPVPIRSPIDFITHVVLAPDSTLFALWLALGSLLAAPIFASSVVAMPLLLDRRVSLWQAVLTSWQTVLANPATMAMWTALILALTLFGMVPMMLGLAVVMPVLGHASWHAYRDLVDVSSLPLREPGVWPPEADAKQRNGAAS